MIGEPSRAADAREPARAAGGGRPHALAQPARVLFVGGTGRSGTHVVAHLLARSRSYALMPVECRFHVEARGFPGLLAGEVSKDEFLRRLRGFWWKGFQTRRFRGLYRFVARERFDAAVEAFDAGFEAEPEEACRRLFWDLLWHRAEAQDAAGVIEQSCDTVAQGATLVRLFPEARFVHVVRDGRDASASRVRQARGLAYPRTRRQGLEWWESRIRAIDAGARAIPPDRLYEVALHDLLVDGRHGARRELLRFAGVFAGRHVRRFQRRRMSVEAANAERWRRGLSERRQRQLDARYREMLDRLDAEGVSCVPLLRRAYEGVGRKPAERERS